MDCITKRSLSLVVGWLNVFLCFLVPVFNVFIHAWPLDAYGRVTEIVYRIRLTTIPLEPIVLGFSVGCVLWLCPTLMLLNGIRLNRRNLIAPWIYMACSLAVMCCFTLIPLHYELSEHDRELALLLCTPFAFVLGFLAMCLVPVTMYYRKIRRPIVIMPTKCNEEGTRPMQALQDVMPIFENC